jgi:hypothetical protein
MKTFTLNMKGPIGRLGKIGRKFWCDWLETDSLIVRTEGGGGGLALCLRVYILWRMGNPMPELNLTKPALTPVRGLRIWALGSIPATRLINLRGG